MSGGSYNYIYSKLSEECEGHMYDSEMNMLIKDLCKVLHDLEWWQSCDYSEEQYRETVAQFKEKWFKGDRKQIAKEYIDSQVKIIQGELYNLFEISELKGENKEFNHEEFYNFLLNTIQPNEMENYRNMFLSSGEIVN